MSKRMALIDYLQDEFISLTEIKRDFYLTHVLDCGNGRYEAKTPNGKDIWFDLVERKCGYIG